MLYELITEECLRKLLHAGAGVYVCMYAVVGADN